MPIPTRSATISRHEKGVKPPLGRNRGVPILGQQSAWSSQLSPLCASPHVQLRRFRNSTTPRFSFAQRATIRSTESDSDHRQRRGSVAVTLSSENISPLTKRLYIHRDAGGSSREPYSPNHLEPHRGHGKSPTVPLEPEPLALSCR